MISRSNIYAKSAKAHEMIKKNSHELTLDERRLLILIDGKRSAGDIIDKFTILDDVAFQLQNLLELGLISPVGTATSLPPPSSVRGEYKKVFDDQPRESTSYYVDEVTKRIVQEEAIEYLGPMGSFVCNQAWKQQLSLQGAIDFIAVKMTRDKSDQFRKNVEKRLQTR